ncbi:JmjC domain, hydroxylase-domain-containing protein [Kickxella alabastrina]|uniref:JmjC domain, hydroxylase-domain-containing protein n=1 Tax=Kickxella alabastrina TaxID=61397 RepID=UPI0022212A46|nr:JmjC domain, hydroxylase-domain-containing protein [Kickxella alabastrina]KAI7828357.1 JmjC domain, hydroxylase-domain-containing protein [Kickxella alabastrina]
MPPQRKPQEKASHLQPRSHIFGLPEAPTFYPTAEEFADPLAYIQSIRPLAEKSGLCKIVPPEGWSPPFSLDTKNFRFKTRIQQLNSLEGKTRTNLNYQSQLYKFHAQQGQPTIKVPQLDHRPIDLYDLRNEVAARGGYQKVNGSKRWAEIGRVLKYDRKTCTSMSTALKSTYQKIVLPFELYLAKHGGSFPTSSTSNRNTPAPLNISGVSNGFLGLDDGNSASALGIGSPSGVRRSKRQRSSRHIGSDSAEPSPPPVLEHSGDDPGFHTHIMQSHFASSVSGGRGISPAISDMLLDSDMSTNGNDVGESSRAWAAKSAEDIPEQCEVCKSGENDESMLICDGCDRGYHMHCLVPPLSAIPTNDWYCNSCVLNAGTDFGFEDGDEYTLESFKQKGDEFKRKFFEAYYRDAGSNQAGNPYLYGPHMEGRVPESVVEQEFWRLIASPFEEVEVEYGADLHSAQHGSGFPTVERNPLEPYARHPWNLNVLPFQPASLFNHIQQDISGMMTPWIYVGMCFSTFCWHNEDHYTYSINYMHWGDTKTWYGVPGSHASKFEEAMRGAVPQLFDAQPDLLFQLVTMLSPEVLLSRGVDVVTCDQRAGEFVVTFPQSYHSGFNQGVNFNEAVNFATPDWMPFDAPSVKRYQQHGRNPVFSHDELLMTMYAEGDRYVGQSWFQDAVVEMVDRELGDRKRVRRMWSHGSAIKEAPWDEVDEGDPDLPEEIRQQCVKCKAFSFLSAVVCNCSPNYIACAAHADSVSQFELLMCFYFCCFHVC